MTSHKFIVQRERERQNNRRPRPLTCTVVFYRLRMDGEPAADIEHCLQVSQHSDALLDYNTGLRSTSLSRAFSKDHPSSLRRHQFISVLSFLPSSITLYTLITWWSKHEANIKQTYSIYTCTTCPL